MHLAFGERILPCLLSLLVQRVVYRAVSSRKKFGDLFLATSSCFPTVLVPMENLAGLHKNCEGMTSD
uniref:Uncharacterized protein n=1 Tax=Salix viminalis TaxID=40686 RepID=A0A6N2MCC3_SALVM